MKVYSFVGESGTGKSYHVTEVARKHHIPLIIDDGLLIRDNTAIAGVSAKGEKTKVASVRRALFFEARHALAVRTAIEKENAERILIVGTSEKMAEKIAEALSLPKPAVVIRIEDVSSAEDIETARRVRTEEGKHVIPVPTFQIRKDFSGYWLDPLQIFRPAGKKTETEKTLVRPTYSYLGDFTIANSVLITICVHETRKFPEVAHIISCGADTVDKNAVILHLDLNLWYGVNIPEVAARIRKRVTEVIEDQTAIVTEDIKITVRHLDVKMRR